MHIIVSKDTHTNGHSSEESCQDVIVPKGSFNDIIKF